jgi:hypothetical protein
MIVAFSRAIQPCSTPRILVALCRAHGGLSDP